MDSSVSLKDQIWFLRMCRHVSNVLCQNTWRHVFLYGSENFLSYVAHGRCYRKRPPDCFVELVWQPGLIPVICWHSAFAMGPSWATNIAQFGLTIAIPSCRFDKMRQTVRLQHKIKLNAWSLLLRFEVIVSGSKC